MLTARRWGLSFVLTVGLAVCSPLACAQANSFYGPGMSLGEAYMPGQSAPSIKSERQIDYSDFIAALNAKRVVEVAMAGQALSGKLIDGSAFKTITPVDPGLISRLIERHVRVTIMPYSGGTAPVAPLGWLTVLFIGTLAIFLILWFRPQAPESGRKKLGFSTSGARLLPAEAHQVTFADVAGIDEAEQDLREIVEFLKEPGKFQKLGAKIPKGCLLTGPPGTGKTLLARAIAGEAGVPFLTMSGSDFVEMYVGVGAARVRDLFAQAKTRAPCIVFIDEIDAVGRHRGNGHGGNDERDQTLNQLLVEMDGFEPNESVILIAATNRPDVLDSALLRPGRFDRHVVVPNPDIAGREKILNVHLRNAPISPDVDIRALARGTPGFSGAGLANLVNEAALMAARHGAEHITAAAFEFAKDKVMMGAERRSMAMTDAEKGLIAYHEAGHALVALHSSRHDPIHKVTIIPRGRALGLTISLPERDRYGYAKIELEARVAMMFGGRVAEELAFGKEGVTTGAGDDIRQATDLARRMVTEFGFSKMLGPLNYAEEEQGAFHLRAGRSNVSDLTAGLIDQEVRRIVEEGEAEARRILTEHLGQLRRLASALLEHETLTGEQVLAVVFEYRGCSDPAALPEIVVAPLPR
jgi:cell division protease FtsH